MTQVWPAPTALLQAFDALDQEPACKAWLAEARQELARLATVASPLDPSVTKSLDRLQHLGDDASRVARKIPSDPVRGQLLRAAYALARRLAVWTSILEFAEQGSAAHHPTLGELQEFVVRRAAVQALVQRREYAEAWSKYLQLEDARRLNPAVGQITDEQRAGGAPKPENEWANFE